MSDYESFNAYENFAHTPQAGPAGGVGTGVLGKGVRQSIKNQPPVQQVQQKQAPVFAEGKFLIDFYGSWCGPCQKMAPVFENLEKVTSGVTFVKVEIGEEQELAMKMGVQSVPTFISIVNGEVVDKMVGANPAKLQQMTEKLKRM
jgi:thioredoxin